MRSSETGRKSSSVASTVWHVAPSCWKQMFPLQFLWTKIRSTWPDNNFHWLCRYTFQKKNGPIMPLDQNPHQTVTRFECVGFSKNARGFSVSQMGQFLLFTYPPRSKWVSSQKMIIFAKVGIFCKSIAGPLPSVVQAYTQRYSFGGRL